MGIEPTDVSLTLGLAVGDPEVVGAFAPSSRFGVEFSFCDAPSPGRQKLAPVTLTKIYPMLSVDCLVGLRSAGQQVSLKRVKNAAAAEGRACPPASSISSSNSRPRPDDRFGISSPGGHIRWRNAMRPMCAPDEAASALAAPLPSRLRSLAHGRPEIDVLRMEPRITALTSPIQLV